MIMKRFLRDLVLELGAGTQVDAYPADPHFSETLHFSDSGQLITSSSCVHG